MIKSFFSRKKQQSLDELKVNNESKDKVLTVRTTTQKYLWMKEHNISASKFFDKKLEELQAAVEKKNDK